MKKGSDFRKPEYPINPLFLDRWSPRAMSGESLKDEELMSLFEAAKWAPSSSNIQPWRFIYAKRNSKNWDKFFNLLVEFNQLWCKNASALICLIAKKTDDNNSPNRNALSDAGAAWMSLALQASLKNLVAHGMAGFDVEKTRKELKIPDDYEIVHMIAVGKPAPPSVLPERMQKSESPNSRKNISEIVFDGEFTT